MKHQFILDENIIHCGIKGIDKHNNPDTTSTIFLARIALNCHKICIDKELYKRIDKHLNTIKSEQQKTPIPNMDLVINHIWYNKDKIVEDFGNISALQNEDGIPSKDIHIVRAANHFKAKIITLDEGLHNAVNSYQSLKALGIEAYYPHDAMRFAKDK